MKKRFLSLFALCLVCLLGVTSNAWGQTNPTKTETFESATATTTYNSTQTIATDKSSCGIAWSIYYGSPSTTSPITDSKSCLIRYYTADAKLGYAKTTTGIKGLTNVTFNAKVTNTGNKMGVWYSTDNTTWNALATDVILTTSSQSKSYDIPSSSPTTTYYVKIGISTGSSTNKKDLIIDDVCFTYTAQSSHTLSSAVSPIGVANITLSASSVEEGSTATATYELINNAYKFSSWSISGTGATLSSTTANPTTVTMGTADATVTANFEARTPATITWHHGNGGTKTKVTNTYTDATIGTLETADEVNGWIFRGWSKSSSIVGVPSFVTTSELVESTTLDLYAVYSQGDNIFKLTTSTDDLEAGAKYLIGYSGYYMMIFNSNFKNASAKTTLDSNNQFTYANGEILTLGGESGAWTFTTSDGKYFSSQTTSSASASLKKENTATDYSYWSISYDTSSPKHAVIQNNGNYNNNSKTLNVSCYSNNYNVYNNQVVYLFKQIQTPTFSTTPAEDVSVTITYIVDGNETSERFDDGNAIVKSEQPSKTGYDFVGWNTKENGSGDTYVAGQDVDDNLTLYAIFAIKSYGYTLSVMGDDTGAMAALEVDGGELEEGDNIQYNKEVTVVVAVNDGYIYNISVKDADENPITLTNEKFTMPASAVTVTVTTQEDPYTYAYFANSDFKDNTNLTSSYATGQITNTYGKWNYNACKQNKDNVTYFQIRNNDTYSYLQVPVMPGKISSITLKNVRNGSGSIYDGYVYFRANINNGTESSDYITRSEKPESAGDDVILTIPDGYYTGYIMSGGPCRFESVEIAYVRANTFAKTISSAKYATLGLPFAVTIPDGVSAYTASVSGSEVTMTKIKTGTIPANTGAVLYAATAGDYDFVPTADVEAISGNKLVAVTTDAGYTCSGDDVDKVYYLGINEGNATFKKLSNNGTIGKNKAYLKLDAALSSSVKVVFIDDEATGIMTMTDMLNENQNGVTFNLAGQVVGSDYKGIVIKNGKKYINK